MCQSRFGMKLITNDDDDDYAANHPKRDLMTNA